MVRALVSSMYKHAGHHDLYTMKNSKIDR